MPDQNNFSSIFMQNSGNNQPACCRQYVYSKKPADCIYQISEIKRSSIFFNRDALHGMGVNHGCPFTAVPQQFLDHPKKNSGCRKGGTGNGRCGIYHTGKTPCRKPTS